MTKNKPEINPFLNNNHINVINSVNKSVSKGDSSGQHSFTQPYVMDRERSTKIYRTKELENIVYSFSAGAAKLFFYITFHLGGRRDSLLLSPSKYLEATQLKTSSFNHARAELVKKNIIKNQKGRSNMYWVNPLYLFSGNRPDYIENTYGKEYVGNPRFKNPNDESIDNNDEF